MNPKNKAVLTYYYTGEKDFWHPEQKYIKKPDPNDFYVLKKSVEQFPDWRFITLANEFEPDWPYKKICKPENLTLYTYKFHAIKNYLIDNPDIEWVWIVDTSDTQMLQDPMMVKDKLYVGLDCYSRRRKDYQTVYTMVNGGFRKFKHNAQTHRDLLQFAKEPCYNCGVLGGHRDIILEFLKDLCQRLTPETDTEMVEFNHVLFFKYRDKVQLCTTKLNTWSIEKDKFWRHK